MDDYELKLLEEAQLSGYDSIADYLKSGNAPLESDPYQGYDEDYGPDIDDDPNRIWTEDKTGEYDINKRFKENLNPDVKDNKWVRKSYTKRWDTPEALKFLKDNAADLVKKKALIQSAADKGNLKPYFEHQAFLKKQGLIPTDAESLYDVTDDWFKRKGLGGQIKGLEDVSQIVEGGQSLVAHDAYSHAFPEKYLGSVDLSKIGLQSVTGAEEARAGMLDWFQADDGYTPIDISKFDKEKLYKRIEEAGTLDRTSPEFGLGDDAWSEAQYYRDKYVKELNDLAKTSKDPLYKSPYGGLKDQAKDPLVGGPYLERGYTTDLSQGVDSINESFYKAAASRYPTMDTKTAKNLVDKSFSPYVEDIATSQQLQLTPKLPAIPVKTSDYEGLAKKLRQTQDLYKDTYFAVSPDMVAAKFLSDNWRGGVVGAGASLLNPEVANRAREDDYIGATKEFGKDVAIGGLTEAGLKGLGDLGMRFAPGFTKAVAPYVGGALNVLGPTVAMAGAFSQGHPNSLTNVVVDKAANYVPGLKADPDTDIGKRAGDFLANQARNVWSKVRGL